MPNIVTVEALTPWTYGQGNTEEAAMLDAARRLKAKIAALTDEQLAALLDGDVTHGAAPDELGETDGWGPLDQ